MAADQAVESAGWRQWSVSLLWVTVLVGATAGVLVSLNVANSTQFIISVSVGLLVVSAVVSWCLWRVGSEPITVPTVLTLARGAALAVFAGFVSAGLADGSLSVGLGGGSLSTGSVAGSLTWVPAVLFGFAAAGDVVDGALARATDSVSNLGARLDTEMDGLTVLFGTLGVVAAGRVPTVFLLVGLARYAFVFGIWRRERRGLAVYDLPPSQLRRLLGGAAMVTIWVALLPVVPSEWSWMLAAVVLIPFIFNFTLDWLAVSGRRG